MCEFCKEHGEGKVWYLNARNYLEERLNDEQRKFNNDLYLNLESSSAQGWAFLDTTDNRPDMLKFALSTLKTTHWGQIIPLEDVEKIFDLSINVVRTACTCRMALHGVTDHRRVCYHVVSTGSDYWKKLFSQWPDMSREMDVVTPEEAKKEFRKFDHDGLVHSVWSFGSPFIGGLCNCTPMDCLGMRSLSYGGPRAFFKAEYVAAVNMEKCNGCRLCMRDCYFGAINYTSAVEKCTIEQRKCLGCGLCRTACSRDAIDLIDRVSIPALKEDW